MFSSSSGSSVSSADIESESPSPPKVGRRGRGASLLEPSLDRDWPVDGRESDMLVDGRRDPAGVWDAGVAGPS